jgi:hypothetical protein
MPSRAGTPPPSQKSLGKRKAGLAGAVADGSEVALPAPRLARQKTRVLPSRSRRVGGPGIGSEEVDHLILDAQKRNRTFSRVPIPPCSHR